MYIKADLWLYRLHFEFVPLTAIMQHPVEETERGIETQPRAKLPSENVPGPTRSDTLPQQASTSPGDGGNVQTTQVPFKERVIDRIV
ncbi:hypothetical protein H0H93_001965 [Arthromyces matolae]|nr:hypothetical protein H0H93_001965 [Arthromyces matolae]